MSATKNQIRPALSINEQNHFKGIDIPLIEVDGGLFISAILLHRKLQVQSHFKDWIRRRIEQYGFEKGLDYRSNLSVRSDGKPGRMATDYLLTVDMCKELAMLEENEVGRKIRRYFIEIEKKYRDWIGVILPRLTVEKDLFGQREGYHYVELLEKCHLSLKSGSRTARVRKNPQEFWRNSYNVLCVSETYGKAIITNAIARRLNLETKERRFVFAAPLQVGGANG
jgi:phage anti-repressor protein